MEEAHCPQLPMVLDLRGVVVILLFIVDVLFFRPIVGWIAAIAAVEEEEEEEEEVEGLTTLPSQMDLDTLLILVVATIFMTFLRMHFMQRVGIDQAHLSTIGL